MSAITAVGGMALVGSPEVFATRKMAWMMKLVWALPMSLIHEFLRMQMSALSGTGLPTTGLQAVSPLPINLAVPFTQASLRLPHKTQAPGEGDDSAFAAGWCLSNIEVMEEKKEGSEREFQCQTLGES